MSDAATIDRLIAERNEARENERAMSDAYVRLRVILGAMDPPTTRPAAALWAYVENVARTQAAEITRLRALSAQPAAVPDIETARRMGEIGAEEFGVPHNDAERLAFEAWMAGHCWSMDGVTWTGSGYRGDGESLNRVSIQAMDVRRLWVAWRDRAALAAAPQAPQQDNSRDERQG